MIDFESIENGDNLVFVGSKGGVEHPHLTISKGYYVDKITLGSINYVFVIDDEDLLSMVDINLFETEQIYRDRMINSILY